MGFFDKEEIMDDIQAEARSSSENEDENENKNKYLSSPEKALELIGKIIGNYKIDYTKYYQLKRIEKILKKDFLDIIKDIFISNKAQLQIQLSKLTKKIYEEQEYQVLKDKIIIGIGGKFSSGKSRFINNLLDIENLLPENQNPTTSIPTYLVKGENRNIDIFTKDNKKISIDIEAMQALTHEFFEKYNIGFSSFVKSIIMSERELPYSKFAFLDTPGYSKADKDMVTIESETDKKKAFEYLKKVNYLIWLIDIENGEISTKDIEFIKDLKLSNKILIIVNKSDKKILEEREKIVNKIKETVKNKDLKVYDVIPFSSIDENIKKENFFKIQQFLDFIKNQEIKENNIEEQFMHIKRILNDEFKNQLKEKEKEREKLNDTIFISNDIFEIQSIVVLYSEILENIEKLKKYQKRFNRKSIEFEKKLKEYYEERKNGKK